MSLRIRRQTARRHASPATGTFRPITERGQTMLLVIGLIALLVALPAAIDVLAVGQTSTSEDAALVIQARQAALAGISDYINHVEAYGVQGVSPNQTTYTQYCSPGQFGCSGVVDPNDAAAFANSVNPGTGWLPGGVTMSASAGASASYRYVVDAPGSSLLPVAVTIYSIGQAGTQFGQHVTATEEGALTVCAEGCLSTPPGGCIDVPATATSAEIVAYGAEGGGSGNSGDTDARGGVGAEVKAYVDVTGGDLLDLVPGQIGVPANPSLVAVPIVGLSLFAGEGGFGGASAVNCPKPQPVPLTDDLGGGNGSLPGGLADAVYTGGAGGGGATIVYDATTGTKLVVAGGGGGGGGGNLLGGLLGPLGLGSLGDSPGPGGAGGNSPGNGQSTSGVLGLLGGSAGGSGGAWDNPLDPDSCASPTTAGAVSSGSIGMECGQTGPSPLAGVISGGSGGGGGGYAAPGSGGGGAGQNGLLGLLGLVGAGGGGGAGSSFVNPASSDGCPAPTISTPTSYPTGDSGGIGSIQIAFFAGPTCGTNPLTRVTGVIRPAATP